MNNIIVFRFWNIAACITWAVALLILCVRSAGGYHHTTLFVYFQLAGVHWTHGEDLYTNWRGFIYSPLVAALFAPFAYLSSGCGVVLWQLLNAVALLGGLATLLWTIFPGAVRRYAGIIYLLIIPFALGNLDIGSSNPLLIGLLMFAVAAVRVQRWGCAALCVAIATSLKIYPLAVGFLICVIAPRQYGWRLFVALLLSALAPFLFQHWSYVFDQYHAWISTRSADNRLNYPINYAPLDLWFLLHWVGHLPVPPLFYTLLQVGGGAAVAVVCAWGKLKGWAIDRLLIGLFCLASIWMMLLGPATESWTYVLLAPPLILVLVHMFSDSSSIWLKGWVLAAFILQLFAVARTSFVTGFKPLWIFSAQPLSALLFLGACLVWLVNDAYWPERSHLEQQ
jgi:hypothetical protein